MTEKVFDQVGREKDEVDDDGKSGKKRSKNGCMTCKIRKKRCDEMKPVCGDCRRLNKKCSWVTPEMNVDEVRELKKQMEILEEDNKRRKRRKKIPEQMVGIPRPMKEGEQFIGTVRPVKEEANAGNGQLALSPFLFNLESYLDEYVGKKSPQIEELDLDEYHDQSSPRDLDDEQGKPVLYYTPSSYRDVTSNLDPMGLRLYEYFRNKLAQIISIVPLEENLYLKTFLPMAHQDAGVLYGLVAWSGFHSYHTEEGLFYLQKSLEFLQTDDSIDTKGEEDISEDVVNKKIANYLILCGAEICRGDVSNWNYLLTKCSEIIKSKGIRNFNDSKTRHWLVSNFAYHDIMTSSIMERGILFPLEDYNYINNLNEFGLNPLHGLSKPLFQSIGQISHFAMNFNRMLRMTNETLSDNSYKNRYELLKHINSVLKKIDQGIDEAVPNMKDLYKLSSNDVELQLTLFESFQITAKLHLRQSLLKLSPKSLEIQLLCVELLRCLDIVLGTNVESSLVFPLFILGTNLCDPRDREWISLKIDDYHKRYQYGNVERLKYIMEVVWKQNSFGEKCIDWYDIVKELGWQLSFA